MTGQTDEDKVVKQESPKMPATMVAHTKEMNISRPHKSTSHQIIGNEYDSLPDKTVALVQNSDLDILNNQTNSMMEKSSKKNVNGKTIFRCKVCGKEALYYNEIKKHIEANHLEGVSIPCNLCEKTFRSRNCLSAHKYYNHRSKKD